MDVNKEDGRLSFGHGLVLSSTSTRQELFSIDDIFWEPWPDNGVNTVAYRAVFNISKNRQGDIYLVVFFSCPSDMNDTVKSWSFAPDKLLMGEQNKPDGKVTRKLRDWFKEQTSIDLPAYGAWGHIDAAYDPHNRTGTIVCNYRSGFKDEKAWKDYIKWNKFKI